MKRCFERLFRLLAKRRLSLAFHLLFLVRQYRYESSHVVRKVDQSYLCRRSNNADRLNCKTLRTNRHIAKNMFYSTASSGLASIASALPFRQFLITRTLFTYPGLKSALTKLLDFFRRTIRAVGINQRLFFSALGGSNFRRTFMSDSFDGVT